MQLNQMNEGMKVFNTVSMNDEVILHVDAKNNLVTTVDIDGVQEDYPCSALSPNRESLEEQYQDVACPTCRTLLILKALFGYKTMSIQDHYGNTVRLTPVYCPICGCNFNDKYE